MTSRRTFTIGRIAAIFALVGMPVAACTDTPDQEDSRMSQSHSSPVTDQAAADEALRFGGIVAPPSAKVLGVQSDKGIDQRYRIVLRIPPSDVPMLLAASHFTVQLVPDAGPFQSSVSGLDLTMATSVRSGEDSIPPGDGRSQTVFRQIAIDESDPTISTVHLWLFTT
jgi:hypothetical protein